MDVHPVVGPIDGFGIPADSFEVLVREHRCGLSDIAGFENDLNLLSELPRIVSADFALS